MTDDYLIWSYEHQAWWKPRKAGYTTRLIDAGLYPKAEAVSICAEANRYSEVTNEVMILATLLRIFKP